MRVVNSFSWHKQHGDFAERHLRQNYFKKLCLSFRKIRKDKNGTKPDGYILNGDQKIALAEIKLIKYQKQKSTSGPIMPKITVDATVRRTISRAKKQLRAINTKLPKIIYLINDAAFLNQEMIRCGIFGKWITTLQDDNILRGGHSGLYTENKNDNKFHDNIVSAIICYVPKLKEYNLWIYLNKNSIPIPQELLDKNHIEELWEYYRSGLISKKT